jgi:hypothetical protein
MTSSIATCPKCKTPLRLTPNQPRVECSFCEVMLKLSASGARWQLEGQELPPERAHAIKQLVLEGKRPEAVQQYASFADITPEDAEQAVTALLFKEAARAMRRSSLRPLLLQLIVVVLLLALAAGAWGVAQLQAGHSNYWWLLALVADVVLALLWWSGPHIAASLAYRNGRETRARILQRVVLMPAKRSASLVLVSFELEGSAPHGAERHQEAFLIADASLDKLAPGNVIRVRHHAGRRRVFPVSPVQVL